MLKKIHWLLQQKSPCRKLELLLECYKSCTEKVSGSNPLWWRLPYVTVVCFHCCIHFDRSMDYCEIWMQSLMWCVLKIKYALGEWTEWHYMKVIRKMELIVDCKQNNKCFDFVYFKYIEETAIHWIFSKDFQNVIKSVSIFYFLLETLCLLANGIFGTIRLESVWKQFNFLKLESDISIVGPIRVKSEQSVGPVLFDL